MNVGGTFVVEPIERGVLTGELFRFIHTSVVMPDSEFTIRTCTSASPQKYFTRSPSFRQEPTPGL